MKFPNEETAEPCDSKETKDKANRVLGALAHSSDAASSSEGEATPSVHSVSSERFRLRLKSDTGILDTPAFAILTFKF